MSAINFNLLKRVGVMVSITLDQAQACYRWARKQGFKITIRTLPDGMKAWRIK